MIFQAPLNIDPGVHSSLNLEALARVPTIPNMPGVPTVPTLPTITEAKVDDNVDKKKVFLKIIYSLFFCQRNQFQTDITKRNYLFIQSSYMLLLKFSGYRDIDIN